jgi:gliding motility-associated lipoprotein GldD
MRLLAPVVLLIAFVLSSCEPDVVYTPRPRGYFRIEMPSKVYQTFDSAVVPYTMEIPDYARCFPSSAPDAPSTWRDLYFGPFRATLYLSYNEITSDSIFARLINQSWEMTEAHQQMTTAIKDSTVLRPDARVFGTVVELGGGAASLLQFYVTDSTHNFLRGSLYFYAVPNQDSLKPVLDYVKADVMHMLATLRWKDDQINFIPPNAVEEKQGDSEKILDLLGHPEKNPNSPGNGSPK